MPVWRNGSRGRLKIYFKQLSAGSSPVTGKSSLLGAFFLPVKRAKELAPRGLEMSSFAANRSPKSQGPKMFCFGNGVDGTSRFWLARRG